MLQNCLEVISLQFPSLIQVLSVNFKDCASYFYLSQFADWFFHFNRSKTLR